MTIWILWKGPKRRMVTPMRRWMGVSIWIRPLSPQRMHSMAISIGFEGRKCAVKSRMLKVEGCGSIRVLNCTKRKWDRSRYVIVYGVGFAVAGKDACYSSRQTKNAKAARSPHIRPIPIVDRQIDYKMERCWTPGCCLVRSGVPLFQECRIFQLGHCLGPPAVPSLSRATHPCSSMNQRHSLWAA